MLGKQFIIMEMYSLAALAYLVGGGVEERGVVLGGVLQPQPGVLRERRHVARHRGRQRARSRRVPHVQHHRAHGHLQRLQRRLHAAVALPEERPRVQPLRLLPPCNAFSNAAKLVQDGRKSDPDAEYGWDTLEGRIDWVWKCPR